MRESEIIAFPLLTSVAGATILQSSKEITYPFWISQINIFTTNDDAVSIPMQLFIGDKSTQDPLYEPTAIPIFSTKSVSGSGNCPRCSSLMVNIPVRDVPKRIIQRIRHTISGLSVGLYIVIERMDDDDAGI